MKKILIITLEYPPIIGGIATYVEQFARSLPSGSVVVLAPSDTGAQEHDAISGVTIVRHPLLFPRFLWPRWLRMFGVVRRIVKQEQIQAIHVHHILPVGYIAWIMKKLFGIPYLIFSHGTDIAAAASYRFKRRTAMLVAKGAEQIIVNSQHLAERLWAAFPLLQEKTTVLYPCPDATFFTAPAQSDIDALRSQYALEGKKVLLTIARFDEGKGFPHLIRVMPRILQQYPQVVWLIIGDGTNEKREEIIQAIQKEQLQNIVRFVGKIPHDKLKAYYYLADMFVLLTHPDARGKEEGLGLVFLEAATAGLPVVAGKSGGVEEAVIHGQTGIVVDVLAPGTQIEESIVLLLQQPAYAKKLGLAGQERMQREFRWEHQVTRIQQWL